MWTEKDASNGIMWDQCILVMNPVFFQRGLPPCRDLSVPFIEFFWFDFQKLQGISRWKLKSGKILWYPTGVSWQSNQDYINTKEPFQLTTWQLGQFCHAKLSRTRKAQKLFYKVADKVLSSRSISDFRNTERVYSKRNKNDAAWAMHRCVGAGMWANKWKHCYF